MAWKKSVKTGRAVSLVVLLLSTSFLPLFSESSVKADRQFSSSYFIHFEDPQFSTVQMNNASYIHMSIPDCMVTDELGSAQLPVYAAHIVIPDGCSIENIQIVEKQFTDYSDEINEYMLLPAQQETRFSEEKNNHVFSHNHSWYQQNEFQPEESHVELGTSYMSGYPVQMIQVFPVRYHPQNRQLYFYGKLKVTVTYTVDEESFSEKSHRFLRKDQHDAERVKDLVLNDEMVDSYTGDSGGDVRMSTTSSNDGDTVLLGDSYHDGLCDSTESVDYVIVTSDSLSDTTGQMFNWSDLITHRNQYDGLNGCIVTIEDIGDCSDYYNENAIFNDSADHLREFCKDAYLDWNAEYVLLGGSWQLNDESRQIVPCRIFTDCYENGFYDTMPSDLYFSNLDGDWYYDSQGVWGGGQDGPNDKLSELSVGRIPVWNAAMVSNIVQKIIWYDTCEDETFLRSAGFLGGDLNWVQSTSKDYMESIRLGSEDYAYGEYTGFEEWNTAFPDYVIDTAGRYYDEDYATEDDAVDAWRTAINNNEMCLISHLDHGSYVNTLSLMDGSSLSNSHYFIGTSQACLSGRYTSGTSGASTFLSSWDDRGAFAMVLNTGYGYGSEYSTAGRSQLQHKIWWDYFFADQTTNFDNWQLGRAMQYTKDEFSSYLNSFSHVYTYVWYSWNLFGDPAQQLRLTSQQINTAPQISNPNPGDNAADVSKNISQLSLDITDSDADSLNWTIETSPSIGSSSGIDEGNGSKTCTIAGLSYNMEYTWFVNVTDGQAWTNETFSFTTEIDATNEPPCLLTPLPNNNSVDVDLFTSSVSIDISDPDGDEFWYTIEGSFILSVSEENQANGTKTATLLDSLPADTEIIWFVNVSDGIHTVCDYYSFHTRSLYMPSAPNDFQVLPINRTSIQLNWIASSFSDKTVVERNTVSSWIRGDGEHVCNTTSEHVIDDDLQPNTTYYYRLWSYNETDNIFSATSSSSEAQTHENNPVIFSHLTIENNSMHCSVHLNFSVQLSDLDGDLISWTISLNESISNSSTDEANGTKTLTLSNLSFNTTYTIWVNATDGFTWTRQWYSFTTELPLDEEKPVISLVFLNLSSPLDTQNGFGWENISCTVEDDSEVAIVQVNISFPNGSTNNCSLTRCAETTIWFLNTTFTEPGNYSMVINATDEQGNRNQSAVQRFSLAPNWDVNMDGTCDLLDFNSISSSYGLEGSSGWIREDVDNNGKVSVLDFVLISEYYDEGWWM